MKHCQCCEFYTGTDINKSKSPIPLEYIKSRLDAGFDLKFIAHDLGIEFDSLQSRIARAKTRGVW